MATTNTRDGSCIVCGGTLRGRTYTGPAGHHADLEGGLVSATALCFDCWVEWFYVDRRAKSLRGVGMRQLAALAEISTTTAWRAQKRLFEKIPGKSVSKRASCCP